MIRQNKMGKKRSESRRRICSLFFSAVLGISTFASALVSGVPAGVVPVKADGGHTHTGEQAGSEEHDGWTEWNDSIRIKANRSNKNKGIMLDGAAAIASPKAPDNVSDPWIGDYVWYGMYDVKNYNPSTGDPNPNPEPIKYRVLDPDSTKYNTSSHTILLDCDRVIDMKSFDDTSSTWSGSDIQVFLNSEDDGKFLSSENFTNEERAAIVKSTASYISLEAAGVTDEIIRGFFGNTYTALSAGSDNDRVFLLDVADVLNPNYGYSATGSVNESWGRISEVENRKKIGENTDADTWWTLRSAVASNALPQMTPAPKVGYIYNTGIVWYREVNDDHGISPAFNIDRSAILFVSAPTETGGGKASGAVGKAALTKVNAYAEDDNTHCIDWKLTLKDDGTMDGHSNFTASREGTGDVRPGSDVTINYENAVANAVDENEYVSVMLCDSTGNEVLYYGRIKQITDANDTAGTVPVTIPSGLANGTYKLYVYSEQYNGDYKTDLASTMIPIEITVKASTPGPGPGPAPHEHEWTGNVTKEPTLFTEGEMTYTCSGCEETYTEPIERIAPETYIEEALVAEFDAMIEDLSDAEGNLKVEVAVTAEKQEDGTETTTVNVGGKEALKLIKDPEKEETVETAIWSIDEDGGDYVYCATAIKPDIHVYDGLKALEVKNDYSIKYSNNKKAGDKALATVSFKGGYKGTPAHKIGFTIRQAELDKDVETSEMSVAASGKAQKPVPGFTFVSNGKTVNKNELKYAYLKAGAEVKEVKDVKEPGDYIVRVTPANGNFNGSVDIPLTVTGEKKLLSDAKVTFEPDKYVYTGKPVTPAKYTLTLDGDELVEGTHFEVSGIKNNVEPGTAKVLFTAIEGNDKDIIGRKVGTFKISKGRTLAPAGEGSDFTYEYDDTVPYSKAGAKPALKVRDGGTLLKKGTDYTVKYSGYQAVTSGKTASITVSGKGFYNGSVTLNYEVAKKDIETLSSNIIADDKAESGKGYKDPRITITDDGKKLKQGTDFTLDPESYADNNNIITVDVVGAGNYTGRTTVSYRYLSADQMLGKVKAEKLPARAYTGREIRLTKKELAKLLYKGNSKNHTYLVPGTDFEVVGYADNIKPGTAKVTLRGINGYAGLKTVKFKITSSKRNILGIFIKGLFH